MLRQKMMAFLDRSARHGFEWGQHDCMLEIADWLDFACGLDIARHWRGRYSSEAELEALIGPDLEAAMREEALAHGLGEASQPDFGDVALVTLAGQDKPLGAILMASGRWRLKTLSGIALRDPASVTVLVAWALPCRPSSRQP